MLKQERGFSLIELALSMSVLALLLTALLYPLSRQVEQQQVRRTEQQLSEIREALYGFAISHGRLPRPARSERDGEERDTCANELECNGFIPWATLGVPRADAWGKLFMYSVARKFADSTARLSLNDAGIYTLHTRLTSAPGDLTPLAVKLVAVVRSFGARNFGRSEQATDLANLSYSNIDEIFNSGTDTRLRPLNSLTFRFRSPSDQEDPASGGPFDDQMVWIPTSIFMRHMVEAGHLP